MDIKAQSRTCSFLFQKVIGVKTILLALAIIMVLLCIVPVSAQQTQVDQGKGRLVMSIVIGLDLTKYNVTMINYLSDNPAIYGGMQHEIMLFNLTSSQNSLYVECQFVNNSLAFYSLYQLKGASPIYAQSSPSTVTEVTKYAMQRYFTYSGLQIAQDAQNTLDNFVGTTPTNITQGNLELRVTTPDNYYNSTQIDWLKNINGADYPTGLSIHFNQNNTLVNFSDLSRFYSVGNTNLTISRDEAINIAQKEAFSNNKMNITSSDGYLTQVTLELPSQPQVVQLSTACRQPLTYSPIWQIQFYSNNPIGGTNGYQVGIWADTGEIQYSHLTSGLGTNNYIGATTNPEPTLPLPTQAQTSTPNVPEFPWLAVVPILIGILSMAVIIQNKLRKFD